jgi:hypothetical protein
MKRNTTNSSFGRPHSIQAVAWGARVRQVTISGGMLSRVMLAIAELK